VSGCAVSIERGQLQFANHRRNHATGRTSPSSRWPAPRLCASSAVSPGHHFPVFPHTPRCPPDNPGQCRQPDSAGQLQRQKATCGQSPDRRGDDVVHVGQDIPAGTYRVVTAVTKDALCYGRRVPTLKAPTSSTTGYRRRTAQVHLKPPMVHPRGCPTGRRSAETWAEHNRQITCPCVAAPTAVDSCVTPRDCPRRGRRRARAATCPHRIRRTRPRRRRPEGRHA